MKKKTKLLFNGAEIAASLIYICAISASLMYVLCRSHAVLCTFIMTAAAFGIFMIFYKLRVRRLFSLLAFVGLFIIIDVICNIITAARPLSFMQFIFTSSDFFDPFFAAAAILLFSMIIGFTIAYFTAYMPRPCFLLLPAFIPLILGSRTTSGLPAGLIIFIAAGFFAAMLGIARPEKAAENYIDDTGSRRERLIAMGALVIAAAAIFTILPRQTSTRYSEYLDSVFTRRSSGYFGSPSLSDLTDTARPNTGNNNPSTNTLFLADARYPALVSSGSYDVYNGEEGWAWAYNDTNVIMGYPQWQTTQKNLNYTALINKLKKAAESGKLSEYKDEISRLPSAPNDESIMTIYVTDGSNTSVILHPQRTYNVITQRSGITTFRNSKDEIFTEDPLGKNAYYRLEYYAEPSGAPRLSIPADVDLGQLIVAAYSENVITAAEYNAFLFEEDSALQYREAVGLEGVTPEIQALADEITAGLSTDYQKARAIEKWFGSAGFYYDLAFSPEEPTAEYFLFKSKRGICTDFATASTLLLRAAGIPARYTEGFVLSEDSKDSYGRYVVTAAQAHAYATAYISGCGWIEIDGTRYAPVSDIEETVRTVMIILIITVTVIVVLTVVFRRQLAELFFAISCRFRKKNDRVRAIYLRTRQLACSVTGADPKSATAEEVRDIIARTLYIEEEAAEITTAADELMYSGNIKAETSADDKKLYRNYRTILKKKRSMKK